MISATSRPLILIKPTTVNPLDLIGSGLRMASELNIRPSGEAVLIYRTGQVTSRRNVHHEARVRAARAIADRPKENAS